MWKRMKRDVLPLLSILLSFINIGLFLFWFTLAQANNYRSTHENWHDLISIQFSIMNVILTCVTVFLVVASFLGYNGIKTYAGDSARKVALEIGNAQMRDFLSKQESLVHDAHRHESFKSTFIDVKNEPHHTEPEGDDI